MRDSVTLSTSSSKKNYALEYLSYLIVDVFYFFI
jgi:hypothetical protein